MFLVIMIIALVVAFPFVLFAFGFVIACFHYVLSFLGQFYLKYFNKVFDLLESLVDRISRDGGEDNDSSS